MILPNSAYRETTFLYIIGLTGKAEQHFVTVKTVLHGYNRYDLIDAMLLLFLSFKSSQSVEQSSRWKHKIQYGHVCM